MTRHSLSGLVWWDIKNYIRTFKYVHVRTVYLTQSFVWTQTFLDLRFTRSLSTGQLQSCAIQQFESNAVAIPEGVCVRTVQKMQIEAGVRLWMLSILKARGKSCMKSYSGQIFNRMCVSCGEHTEKDDPSVSCCLYHVPSNVWTWF